MARRLTLRNGDLSVTARLAMPDRESGAGIVLAHGAGAGQDHPWMVAMRNGLAEHGLPTMTFNYAYTEAGRKAPDRPEKLLAVHAAALQRMRRYVDTVILAGKSMGGRMASHLAAETDAEVGGLVYYGYPLVPLGRGTPRSTEHLEEIVAPQLFFCGTRDRLSPPPLVVEVAAGLREADVVVVDDADHSFAVPKRSGTTTAAVLDELAASTSRWVRLIVASGDQSPELGGV
jgi:predicted alpha/beta-hydrolase family hydrolase